MGGEAVAWAEQQPRPRVRFSARAARGSSDRGLRMPWHPLSAGKLRLSRGSEHKCCSGVVRSLKSPRREPAASARRIWLRQFPPPNVPGSPAEPATVTAAPDLRRSYRRMDGVVAASACRDLPPDPVVATATAIGHGSFPIRSARLLPPQPEKRAPDDRSTSTQKLSRLRAASRHPRTPRGRRSGLHGTHDARLPTGRRGSCRARSCRCRS